MAKDSTYQKKEKREVAFSGRLRTADPPTNITAEDFQTLTNMRYYGDTIRSVTGQTAINSTAVGSSSVNLYHFRKGDPTESHLILDRNGNVYDNTTAIPGTGNFGSSLYADPSGTPTGRYANAPSGALCRCTGSESLLWGGTKFRCAGFVDNPTSGELFDYSDVITNTLTDSNNIATIHTAGSYAAIFYVGSILPIKGFYLDMNTANNQTTTMAVKYYSGSAWTAVSSLSDGTASGGISLAQDGWVTFSSTKSVAKQYAINKKYLFWYQVTVSGAADFDGTPKINTVYVDVPFQPIQDIWDGQKIPIASHLLYYSSVYHDYTVQTVDDYYDNSEAANTAIPKTFANYGNDLGASGYAYYGFPVRITGLMISIGSNYENIAAATIDALDYWNGDTWVDLTSSMVDGTLGNSKTMGQSGWITWTAPTSISEQPITNLPGHSKIRSQADGGEIIVGKDEPLYYYRISFSAALQNDSAYAVRVYHVAGIPAPDNIGAYTFPVNHAGRLFLCDESGGERNSVRYSSFQTANVFSGSDSDIIYFGDNNPIVAAASLYSRYGSTISDHLLVCKKNETWVLTGSDPEDFRTFQVDNVIGCIAPLTMATVGIPGEQGVLMAQTAAMWLSARGVEVYTNGIVKCVSEDIRDKFDPLHANFIGASTLPTLYAFYDPIRYEYHLCSSSAEWVFNLEKGKWFKIDRGTSAYLVGGTWVADTNGITYCYGFLTGGTVMRLENGTTFATPSSANNITSTVRLADIALFNNSIMFKNVVDWGVLVARTKATTAQTISVTHYVDGKTSGTSIDTIDPTDVTTGYVNLPIHGISKIGTFHSPELSITTSDENIGFEPILYGCAFTVYPREK